MPEIYFKNEHTGKRYRVVKFDRDAGKITLVGEAGIEFTDKYDRTFFEDLGYRLETA